MDTKQLLTGKPREGFYPVVQDTVTVIELNEAVMNLTSESSSEEIIAAFDDIDSFNTLVEQVRDTENIVNGILVSNGEHTGKITANIIADNSWNLLIIEFITEYASSRLEHINLTIHNNNGTFTCDRHEVIISKENNNIFYIDSNDIVDGFYTSEKYLELNQAIKDNKIIIKYDSLDPTPSKAIATNYYDAGEEGLCVVFVTYIAVDAPIISVLSFYGGFDNYKVTTKELMVRLVTNGDGTKFLSDDGKYKTIEVGDKTNVLILSLENDLANGQKDSPVDAEVSTALKDAISTGKACVIKSANSDILANLQQTGDNVTIVMEQISRIGQTFVAVNTTITVNTATNIISDYQTGAIVLETEGDGSKFLSNDGSYKEINDIYYIDAAPTISTGLEGVKTALANNKLPVFKHLYEGNPAYELSPAICSFSSDGRLVSYMILNTDIITIINVSQTDELTFEQIPTKQVEKINVNSFVDSTIPVENYNKLQVQNGTKVILIDDPDEGYYSIPAVVRGLSTIIIEYIYKEQYNKITIDSSYNVTKETKDLGADLSNYLTKDNTTEYTPTSDYQPATKKYVDDKVNIPVIDAGISDITDDITGDYILNIPNNTTQVYLVNLNVLGYVPLVGYYVPIEDRFYYKYSGYLKREDGTGNKMNNGFYYVTIDGSNLHIELKQLILTESQYSALGDTSSDDVLYFITPD